MDKIYTLKKSKVIKTIKTENFKNIHSVLLELFNDNKAHLLSDIRKQFADNKLPYMRYFESGIVNSIYFKIKRIKNKRGGNDIISVEKIDNNPLLLKAVEDVILKAKKKANTYYKNSKNPSNKTRQIATNCISIKENQETSSDFTSLSFELKIKMMQDIRNAGEWKNEFINLLFTR